MVRMPQNLGSHLECRSAVEQWGTTDIKVISSSARAVDPWSFQVVPEQDRRGDHQNGLVEHDVI